MSDTTTEFDVGPLDDEELVPVPLVQCYVLDGGYVAATISLAGDPDAPNLGAQVKTRLIMAHTAEALDGLVTSCLISDYELSQDDAALVPRLTMVEGGPTPEEPVTEERETEQEALGSQVWEEPAKEA
jgi:hypothetical protein